jgi:hypothetical protein
MQELHQKWKKQSINASFPALQKKWSDEMLLKFNETKNFFRTKMSKQMNDEIEMESASFLKGYQEMLDQLYHAKNQVEAYRQYLKQFLQVSSALGYEMLGVKRKQQSHPTRSEAPSFARMFQTIDETKMPRWNQEENIPLPEENSNTKTTNGESHTTMDDLFNEILQSLSKKISTMESYKPSIDTRRQMRNDLDMYTRKLEFFDKNPIKLTRDEQHTRVTLEAKLERTRAALNSATQELVEVFANYEIERQTFLNHELDMIRQALHHFFRMGMEVTMYSLSHTTIKDQPEKETEKERNTWSSSENQEEVEDSVHLDKQRTDSGPFDSITETLPSKADKLKNTSSSNFSFRFGMNLPATKDVYRMTSKCIPRRNSSSPLILNHHETSRMDDSDSVQMDLKYHDNQDTHNE